MSTRAKIVGLLALIGSAASAHAGLTATVMHIEASSMIDGHLYTGSYDWIVAGDTNNDGVIDTSEGLPSDDSWTLGQSIAISADGNPGIQLATINSAEFSYEHDPVVSANFNVQAGFFNTTFNVSSGVLNFGDPDQNVGVASASISVTGNGNGASIFETDNSGLFRAIFNGGSTFTYLHNLPVGGSLTAPANQTVTYTDAFGYAPLGGTASDISAKFAFTLSAGDQASGTSVFTVVPAPASVTLLGLSGLATVRRRR